MSTPICLAVNSSFVIFQPNWQDAASDEDQFVNLEISHSARGAEQFCNDNVIPPLLNDGFSILEKILP